MMKRTIATPPGVEPVHVPFTPEETAAREAEEAEWLVKSAAAQKLAARKEALAAVWPDPFDIVDDILERGIEAVKAERDDIKSRHPKT